MSPSSVDLPEPEAPTIATVSASAIDRSTSFKIVSVPSLVGTLLVSWRISIMVQSSLSAAFLEGG